MLTWTLEPEMMVDPAARIISKDSWGPYFLFSVESPPIARRASPGQFVMVKVSDATSPLLRRPLSLCDRRGDRFWLFFQVSGQGTALLARKEPEDRLDVIGPLGRGFRLPQDARSRGASLLVGGGRGVAPLLFLAAEMRSKNLPVKLLYGGRTDADLPLRDKLRAENIPHALSTDDGSRGLKGFVTELLQNELGAAPVAGIYACGPEPMLRAVAEMAAVASVPAQLSLESHMGCGFGACWGCVKRIRRNGEESWVKVCEEGPVFPAEEVVWP